MSEFLHAAIIGCAFGLGVAVSLVLSVGVGAFTYFIYTCFTGKFNGEDLT